MKFYEHLVIASMMTVASAVGLLLLANMEGSEMKMGEVVKISIFIAFSLYAFSLIVSKIGIFIIQKKSGNGL